jgi:hypothetical protein
MGIGDRQPEIIHLGPPEAVWVVWALGTQVDDRPHPQLSQPFEIVEHQGSAKEHLLIDDIPPVECQDEGPK